MAVHGGGEVGAGVVDAVVGDAVLGEVVGADFFGAVAGADEGFAGGGGGGLGFGALFFEEAGAEDDHGFFAVLELGAFVLHGDDDAGGEVGDADGGISGVDGLATVTAGAVDINL